MVGPVKNLAGQVQIWTTASSGAVEKSLALSPAILCVEFQTDPCDWLPYKGNPKIYLTKYQISTSKLSSSFKPSCHFSNSLSQLSTVLRGHTTRAVLKFSFSHSSTVWRNVTTCRTQRERQSHSRSSHSITNIILQHGITTRCFQRNNYNIKLII